MNLNYVLNSLSMKSRQLNSRDRFYATINREEVDRPACWLGLPVPDALPGLFAHFGVNSLEGLKKKINDDIWPIEVPYNFPPANHIACAFAFAKTGDTGTPDKRTLTVPGFFEDYDDPSDVEKFDWPDPSKHLDIKESARRVRSLPTDKIRLGILWSCHFQDVCSAFGMETALVKAYTNPQMFRAVINRITRFYIEANGIFYEATKGYLDCILIGDDFGAQNNMLVDPDTLREFVFPGTRKLIDQAKSYGLHVIYHSCGSIFPVIEDLIQLGVDIIHPIQALAKDMQPEKLKETYGSRVAFCGGVDAQYLLVNGSPEEISKKVRELKEIFPTGLIFSPSHEAILPDVPPRNVEAMFNEL